MLFVSIIVKWICVEEQKAQNKVFLVRFGLKSSILKFYFTDFEFAEIYSIFIVIVKNVQRINMNDHPR